MSMLEINLREHADALMTLFTTRYTKILNMGVTRPLVILLLTRAVTFHVDSKQEWVKGSKSVDSWDVTQFTHHLFAALETGSAEAGQFRLWIETLDERQAELEFAELADMWNQINHELCDLVSILVPKRTWEIIEINPVRERLFLKLGMDFRVAQYERLKVTERAFKDLLHVVLNEDVRLKDMEPLQDIEIAFERLQMHRETSNRVAITNLLKALERFHVNRDKL
jgi:hypothetical protein